MKNLLILRLMLILGIVAVVNPGCTDLDEVVYSEFTDANFPDTEPELIAYLGATYTSLYGLVNHNSYWSIQEVSSDEAMIPQRGPDWFDGGVWLRAHRHEFEANEGSFSNAWNFLYGGISNCNRIIEGLEGFVADGLVDASVATAFIAEVRGLRAMYYYWLLDAFGNVPIIQQFAGGPAAPATNSRQEVYNFVEEELLAGVAALPEANGGSSYARFNAWSARTLLAKLYLNAEVYTGTAQWEKCKDQCEYIIENGPFGVEGNYFSNFNVPNDMSSENIFVIPYDRNSAQGFNIPAQTLHYGSQATFELSFQPWNGYCTLQEFYDSYSDDDKRKGEYGNQKVRGNFHAGPQFESDGTTPIKDGSFDDPDGENLVFDPVINEHFPGAQRQAGARVGKFQFVNGATQDLDVDFPVLRYSDVLMMIAEAYHNMNMDDLAVPYFNEVYTRARTSADAITAGELTDELLLAERGREFFYEGWRRSDLIRFDKWGDEWDFKPASEDFKKLFPIPQAQRDANPNLAQNPGY